MTTIYLVRHGETEANRQFRFQGCIDLPLTEDGLKQAECLAETLKDIHFDHFYSSPLPRAWNTANIVNKYHNAPLLPDPALLEATGGIVQGMSGSPIIQDGKLVGAVTHVLINDPTMGYGIFIDNMLRAA